MSMKINCLSIDLSLAVDFTLQLRFFLSEASVTFACSVDFGGLLILVLQDADVCGESTSALLLTKLFKPSSLVSDLRFCPW